MKVRLLEISLNLLICNEILEAQFLVSKDSVCHQLKEIEVCLLLQGDRRAMTNKHAFFCRPSDIEIPRQPIKRQLVT